MANGLSPHYPVMSSAAPGAIVSTVTNGSAPPPNCLAISPQPLQFIQAQGAGGQPISMIQPGQNGSYEVIQAQGYIPVYPVAPHHYGKYNTKTHYRNGAALYGSNKSYRHSNKYNGHYNYHQTAAQAQYPVPLPYYNNTANGSSDCSSPPLIANPPGEPFVNGNISVQCSGPANKSSRSSGGAYQIIDSNTPYTNSDRPVANIPFTGRSNVIISSSSVEIGNNFHKNASNLKYSNSFKSHRPSKYSNHYSTHDGTTNAFKERPNGHNFASHRPGGAPNDAYSHANKFLNRSRGSEDSEQVQKNSVIDFNLISTAFPPLPSLEDETNGDQVNVAAEVETVSPEDSVLDSGPTAAHSPDSVASKPASSNKDAAHPIVANSHVTSNGDIPVAHVSSLADIVKANIPAARVDERKTSLTQQLSKKTHSSAPSALPKNESSDANLPEVPPVQHDIVPHLKSEVSGPTSTSSASIETSPLEDISTDADKAPVVNDPPAVTVQTDSNPVKNSTGKVDTVEGELETVAIRSNSIDSNAKLTYSQIAQRKAAENAAKLSSLNSSVAAVAVDVSTSPHPSPLKADSTGVKEDLPKQAYTDALKNRPLVSLFAISFRCYLFCLITEIILQVFIHFKCTCETFCLYLACHLFYNNKKQQKKVSCFVMEVDQNKCTVFPLACKLL